MLAACQSKAVARPPPSFSILLLWQHRRPHPMEGKYGMRQQHHQDTTTGSNAIQVPQEL
jgi:hypothetical protein